MSLRKARQILHIGNILWRSWKLSSLVWHLMKRGWSLLLILNFNLASYLQPLALEVKRTNRTFAKISTIAGLSTKCLILSLFKEVWLKTKIGYSIIAAEAALDKESITSLIYSPTFEGMHWKWMLWCLEIRDKRFKTVKLARSLTFVQLDKCYIDQWMFHKIHISLKSLVRIDKK